jgi:hypothetical protein
MPGLGVVEPPPWPMRVVGPSQKSKLGMAETTQEPWPPPFGLGVGSTTPKGQTLTQIFFFFWPCGGSQAKRE